MAQLRISGHLLTVEIAHTEATRSRGLMFRQSMDENRGMLFIFSQPGRHGMWMMNTDIPLSVAFVDEKGCHPQHCRYDASHCNRASLRRSCKVRNRNQPWLVRGEKCEAGRPDHGTRKSTPSGIGRLDGFVRIHRIFRDLGLDVTASREAFPSYCAAFLSCPPYSSSSSFSAPARIAPASDSPPVP